MPATATNPRRLRALGAALLSVVILAACSDDDPTATPSTSIAVPTTTIAPRLDDGRLVLGAFLPSTGPGASLGLPMIDAVEQAVATINSAGGVFGQPVELRTVDESTGTGLDDLLAADVDAIIGPASSTIALSQLDAAVRPGTGVVTCSPSATAMALDDYPDNKLFFRTVPSDSLQMMALARRAEFTGVDSIAVGYLDDPYGRGLAGAFTAEIEARRRLDLTASVGVRADQEDLKDAVAELLASQPRVVVVLGDADDGSRLLAAIDAATEGDPPQVIINDAIRSGRQTLQSLSDEFLSMLTGVAPLATPVNFGGPAGYFSSNAVDCVNLIALAAVEAQSDAPTRIQAHMASVSVGGRVCVSFNDCAEKLTEGLRIDYNGVSGSVELSTTTGDLVRGWFEVFEFDDEGVDHPLESGGQFEVP